jgi:acetylornithine deacetylase/succinyl-diaminopimelate desuccinylase-like protein
VDSGAPGRTNVFVRLPGKNPTRPALMLHGHLDVVPAEPSDWQVHPFSGAVVDGYVWGRGAIDMKNMDGMMLALARFLKYHNIKPPRDIVFAFVADEEAGGKYGSQWLVQHRPDLFQDVSEAIGEVGGFTLTVPKPDGTEKRLYLIETAEKGLGWMRLVSEGAAGHGSFLHEDNAVSHIANAVSNIANYQFPLTITPTVAQLLQVIAEETGWDIGPETPDLEGALGKFGSIANIIGATLRNTVNPTMLNAGYKPNVIPQKASAALDCRIIPGQEEEFEKTIDKLLGPDVEREWIVRLGSYETEFSGDLLDAMVTALKRHDPDARAVPFMLAAGTDAKAFATLGMRCFGFVPLRLPKDLDFSTMFHGIDERVPVESLIFGVKVLQNFLLAS